jgi:putative sterol carrier protein
MLTVKQIFDGMAGSFQADMAKNLDTVIQYEITGEGGGDWYATIKDATCKVTEGKAASPALTLTLSAADWVDMSHGKLNGQTAFMTGKLKLKGDMGLAMRLATLFKTVA